MLFFVFFFWPNWQKLSHCLQSSLLCIMDHLSKKPDTNKSSPLSCFLHCCCWIPFSPEKFRCDICIPFGLILSPFYVESRLLKKYVMLAVLLSGHCQLGVFIVCWVGYDICIVDMFFNLRYVVLLVLFASQHHDKQVPTHLTGLPESCFNVHPISQEQNRVILYFFCLLSS